MKNFLLKVLAKLGLEFYSDLTEVETNESRAREQAFAAMRKAMVAEQGFSEVWFDDAVSRADEIIELQNGKLHGKLDKG